MLGYLNAPSPFDADGWFCTEDRVEVDGDWLRILGRVTDLMNIGGQKVYPAEVEDVILELDNIEDVAVFAEQNALIGAIVVARVVTETPESRGALKKRIRAACAERLAAFKVPTKVVLAEQPLYSARHKKMRRARRCELAHGRDARQRPRGDRGRRGDAARTGAARRAGARAR